MSSSQDTVSVHIVGMLQVRLFAKRLSDFMQALKDVMDPVGMSTSGYSTGSAKDQQPPVYMILNRRSEGQHNLTFASLQPESSMCLTFSETLISIPSTFSGTQWFCVDTRAVITVYQKILSRSKTIKEIFMCIIDGSRLVVNYQGQLSTNTALSSITDTFKSMYKIAMKNQLLPSHLYDDIRRCAGGLGTSAVDRQAISKPSPSRASEWTTTLEFENPGALDFFLERTKAQKNQRVVVFGVEFQVSPGELMMVISIFKFNPDDFNDTTETSYEIFAERVRPDAKHPHLYHLRVLNEDSDVPAGVQSAIKAVFADRGESSSVTAAAETAAAASAEKIFGASCVQPATDGGEHAMPKTVQGAIKHYLQALRHEKKDQPRANLAFAILMPRKMFAGPHGCRDSDTKDSQALQFTFSKPQDPSRVHNTSAPPRHLSAVVESQWKVPGITMGHKSASTFDGGSSYPPETLASEFLKQIKVQRLVNQKQSALLGKNCSGPSVMGDPIEGTVLLYHRIRRAIERFTASNSSQDPKKKNKYKGQFISALSQQNQRSKKKKNKRKTPSEASNQGQSGSQAKRSRLLSSSAE